MNIFDIVGIASKIPYELLQKLQSDAPKIERLLTLSQEATPHVKALIPIEQEAVQIWSSISPDVQALVKAIGVQP